MSSHRPAPRRWLGRLTLLAIVLSLMIGVVLLNAVGADGLDRLKRNVQATAPTLSLVRWTGIASLYVAWPHWLQFCRRHDWIDTESEQLLRDRRNRWTLWLVILELIVGQEVLDLLQPLLDDPEA